MLTRNYLLLYFLVAISCNSPKDREQEVKVFLTEWSAALTAREESMPRFYDPKFAFPKAVFNDAEGLNYTFDIEHVKIVSNEDRDDMQVTVPFHLTYPDNTSEEGSIDLTITKTEKGFLILQMSQQLAMKLKEYNLRQTSSDYSEVTLQYDSLLGGIRTIANALSQHYDSVVFYTEVNNQMLFYVIKGSWEYPYHYENEKQRDSGNYKIGVVTAENKVIIPVEHTKIYNPDGSFIGMIEVESNGVRGLFRIGGELFLPVEYDGIYPANIPGAFAQVKKGDSYGWVSDNGKVSFDPSSHENKKLFQSPIETNAILEWQFKFPGQIKLLIDPYTHVEDANGVIIYPSYIRDMGITPIGNGLVFIETSAYGMGMTDTEIKFEKVESLSDKFFGLVSFFMESGADARGYHSAKNDLLVVDKSMKLLDRQENLTADYGNQDPCGGEHPSYRTIEPGLYESENGNGLYDYYKITAEGTVEQLKTNRQYNFTKFAKIDDTYLDRCRYENLDWEDGKPNTILMKGVSMEELDIMRNEIFAEYGFIFKSSKWKTYFESQPWYKPQYSNVDQFLTETDKANIKFILEYQRSHKDIQVQRDSIRFGWAG
ncbi:MAG: YARHG domain-containing protein [Bacteroidota bacterium]